MNWDNLIDTQEERLGDLKDRHSGKTGYILTCGPSLGDYSSEFLKDRLANEIVLSVKQSYTVAPEIVDYHFFNAANLPEPTDGHYYNYGENSPTVVSSCNFPLGTFWNPPQHIDFFFPVPVRFDLPEKERYFCFNPKFDDHTFDKTMVRPCGPGIMYETVIFMAKHLGFNKIVALGWDLSKTNPEPDSYDHFYNDRVSNPGTIMDWEVKETCKLSEPLFFWLKEKGVELELASKQSALFKGIPRIEL